MEEIRIDVTKQAAEELAVADAQSRTLFEFNHTLPCSDRYQELMHDLFPAMGDGSRIGAPLSGVRFHKVAIGRDVIIMPGCLMMAAGGITIKDGAMIAANVQLISNNHDLYERQIITCRPICIGKKAWIGAGATILPGVTIGDNAVVGAASVVTHDVAPDTIVAGNPAKVIRRIEPLPACGATNEEDEVVQLGLDSCGD